MTSVGSNATRCEDGFASDGQASRPETGAVSGRSWSPPQLDLLRAAGNEAVHSVRSALWPLARLHPLPEPTPGGPSAVLVHGLFGHRDMLRPLARRLFEAGWGHVGRVGYPSTRSSIEDIGEHIGAAIRACPDGPVDLVGHSLGAVACRAWLRSSAESSRVRRFVSLGGPHAGTSLYRFVPGRLRPVLDPRGSWVRQMADGVDPVPTTVIRARYDHQVFPPRRARIDGAAEIVIGGVGHNGLLWHSASHDAVLDALSG